MSKHNTPPEIWRGFSDPWELVTPTLMMGNRLSRNRNNNHLTTPIGEKGFIMKFYDEFSAEEQVVIKDLFQQVVKGNFKRDKRVTFLSILIEEEGADGKVVRYNATKRGINTDKIDGRVVCIEGFVFDVHHFVVWFMHESVTQY